MSGDEYARIQAVNWSALKWLRESPLAYRYAMDNPQPDKEAFAIGRALHALVLEPETFADRFVTWTGGRRYGREWDEFRGAHEGRTILREEDETLVRDMAYAVTSHPLAMRYVSGGVAEQPVVWTDPATGMRCKARPDLTHEERRILLDLKSTRSAEGRRFGHEAARFGYPGQLAHYEAGCLHGLGWAPEQVVIVAVEKAPPHDVGVFEIDPQAREIAAAEVAELLARLKECTERGEWPGRSMELQALQLPAWVYADDDEDDADGYGLSFGGK